MSAHVQLLHCIDTPQVGALVDPLALKIEGWVFSQTPDIRVLGVAAYRDGALIAETRELWARADVIRAMKLPAGTRPGFMMLGHIADFPPTADGELTLRARLSDGTEPELGRRRVKFIRTDYRQKPYGVLLHQHMTEFRRRHEIYGSGPSQAETTEAFVGLLGDFLGAAPKRVIDVGCGIGSYGRALLARGYDWFGVEIDADDCAELAKLGLPHRQVDGGPLPFPDGAFDAAICIEVLEHIAEPQAFLAEIRRVAPRLLVSVPNVELLAYLSPYQAVPWHMLEGDHKNFFGRWGLRALLSQHFTHVEVISYSPMPLPSPEGIALDYHLLAIAEA